jgi:hypothetical protein
MKILSAIFIGLMVFLAIGVSTARGQAMYSRAPAGIGIMYLENSDAVGDPIHDWSKDPALTNPYVQGIALRTQWDRVEPHQHANANDFYWDFLDQGVALAAAHGKKVSILVTAGVTTPQRVYHAGAAVFNVTEGPGVTISAPATQSATGVGIVTAQISPMPLPWDSVFQAKRGAFIQALAARCGNAPNLAYVVTGVLGWRAESFFCFTD